MFLSFSFIGVNLFTEMEYRNFYLKKSGHELLILKFLYKSGMFSLRWDTTLFHVSLRDMKGQLLQLISSDYRTIRVKVFKWWQFY